MAKVALLGLTGFDPGLVEQWLEDLPNLRGLQQEGIWGKIQSSVPPTVVTAWTCALSSRNPGAFGFWDVAYRGDFSYGEPKVIDCRVKDQRVGSLYNVLHMSGQKVALVNVPASWPPPRIPGGYSVSPTVKSGLEKGFTWPKSLADEVQGLVGEYILETPGVEQKTLPMEKGSAQETIRETDLQRFTLLKHFIVKRQCDCVITVAEGPDRAARLYYRFLDERHRRYDADPERKNALHDYYLWVDMQIGEIRRALDENTALFILSDHGVQRLDGLVNLNEWLIKEGYMALEQYPSEPAAFGDLKVDWSKTRAWATGRAGQIYINVRGRESGGIVATEGYNGLLDELIARIKQIPDEKGNALATRVLKRNEIYSGPFAEYAPDLFVCFDEGRRRTNERVGYGPGSIHLFDASLAGEDGSDSLVGYFCLAGPGIPSKGEYSGATLYDVAPTVLDVMDLEIPQEMEGVSISGKERTPEEEEALVQERLKFLGY
ncbi:MAG: alkaline phosphatase family protein [Proteobacteria bacterium]|nr:alkaline phosphatase family protein [Pseudomonadota bacterium]